MLEYRPHPFHDYMGNRIAICINITISRIIQNLPDTDTHTIPVSRFFNVVIAVSIMNIIVNTISNIPNIDRIFIESLMVITHSAAI